jgi:hypothetical protein
LSSSTEAVAPFPSGRVEKSSWQSERHALAVGSILPKQIIFFLFSSQKTHVKA